MLVRSVFSPVVGILVGCGGMDDMGGRESLEHVIHQRAVDDRALDHRHPGLSGQNLGVTGRKIVDDDESRDHAAAMFRSGWSRGTRHRR